MKRYEKYGRKVSWIVKRHGKYSRKVSWIVKRLRKCKIRHGCIHERFHESQTLLLYNLISVKNHELDWMLKTPWN